MLIYSHQRKVFRLAMDVYQIFTQLNQDKPLDNISLAVMHKRLPDEIKRTLFDPYMSADGNQVRFGIRVIDSDNNLQRDALLKKIRHDLIEKFKLEEINDVAEAMKRREIIGRWVCEWD